jgi:hypothetical protein
LAVPVVDCGHHRRRRAALEQAFTAAVRSPIEHWCLATDGVRYQGVPVARLGAKGEHTRVHRQSRRSPTRSATLLVLPAKAVKQGR